MEKNTKTILIVGGVAAVGLVTYMMYIAMNPAKPTTVVKSPTTTLANPSGISGQQGGEMLINKEGTIFYQQLG